MTREEREQSIADIRRLKAEYMNGRKMNDTTERKCKSFDMAIKALEQEPKTGQYEKHIDHTDCIWYGSDSGCPVTCSQYRDGWNDAMDYIFKNGKGYQPYRHNG